MPPSTYIPLSQRTTTPKTAGISIPETSRLAYVNNNPGNLRFAGQQGAVEGEGGFAKFNSPEEGYEGLKRQIKLDTSRGLDLRGFVSKYAPPTENDTEQYIQQLTEWTGADETTPLSALDLDTLAQAVAKKESSTTTAQKAGKMFGGMLSKYIPLAQRTIQEIPSETAKLFSGAIQKTGEGLDMIASSLEMPQAPKYVPIKDRTAQMTRAVKTPQIDPTGVMGGIAKTGKALANIHPDDLYAMTQYIDMARIGKEVPEGILRGAEALAQKFGISLDKSTKAIANEFEKILQGKGGVDTVESFKPTRVPVQQGKVDPAVLAGVGIAAAAPVLPFVNEKVGEIVENIPETTIGDPMTYQAFQEQEEQKPPTKYKDPVRNVEFDDKDVEELRSILYGEVGNRNSKRGLEARVVINTALNRLKENKESGNGPQTLLGVLQQEGQYQAFGDKQYEIEKSGEGDKQKLKAIDEVLNELKEGRLTDNTGGNTHYVHITSGPLKDSIIHLTTQEFAKYYKMKSTKERDAYVTSLLR